MNRLIHLREVSIEGKTYLRYLPFSLPAVIRESPHWLLSDHTGRPVKTDATGDSKTKPEHWADFDSISKICAVNGKLWPYIVLTETTVFTVFDVDFKPRRDDASQRDYESESDYEARIARGNAALKELRRFFPDRYEEKSKSGLGTHIIVQGRFLGPGGKGRREWCDVEVYAAGHGIALTGHVVDGMSDPARYDDAEIQRIRDLIKREDGTAACIKNQANDQGREFTRDEPAIEETGTIIASLLERNSLIPKLWAGEWGCSTFPSQSEADFSLACSIVEASGNHAQQEELFRSSGLYRDDRKLDLALKAARKRVGETRADQFRLLDDRAEEVASETPFPLHCFPPIAGMMAKEIARVSTSGNEALAAACVLGVASASLGAGLQVSTGGGRTTKGNLYILAIAPSGTGKGETFSPAAKPFLEAAAEAVDTWEASQKPGMISELAMLRKRAERLLKDGANSKESDSKDRAIEEHAAIQVRVTELERLTASGPCFHVGDATKEALQTFLPTQPGEALASMSSEARGIISVIRGRYGNGQSGGDEDFYCSAYSGDAIAVNRVGRPRVTLRSPCLSILWMVQPDAAATAFADRSLVISGMLPRFLLFDSNAEPQERYEAPSPIAESVSSGWNNLVRSLLDCYRMAGNDPKTVEVAADAAEIFHEFEREAVRLRKSTGDLASQAPFVARWAENAWRISLVLHAALNGCSAHTVPITKETAQNAVEILRWFAARQLAFLSTAQRPELQGRLLALLAVLSKSGGTSTVRELGRSHRFIETEIRQLQFAFPGHIVIEKRETGGRPSQIVRLKSESKSDG
jgi:hypothetical protein